MLVEQFHKSYIPADTASAGISQWVFGKQAFIVEAKP